MVDQLGWKVKRDNIIPEEKSRILEDITQKISALEHPCINQFRYTGDPEFETRNACTAICVCLIEQISRTGSVKEIEWEEKVLDLGGRLYKAWKNRNRRVNDALMPHVEELFQVISKKNGFVYSQPIHGKLSKSELPTKKTSIIYDISYVLRINLRNQDDFVLITVRDTTVLAWVDKTDPAYVLFDSHGSRLLEPSEKSFMLRCSEIEDFIIVFLTLYYRESDRLEDNMFQAFKVWKQQIN